MIINVQTIGIGPVVQLQKRKRRMFLRPLFLLLSLFLSNFSHADSYAPIITWQLGAVVTYSPEAACEAFRVSQNATSVVVVSVVGNTVNCRANGWIDTSIPGGPTCPVGTLTGGQCVAPDCVAPQVRIPATGLCSVPPDPCQNKVDLGTKFGIYNFPVGSSITGTYCDNGCRLALGSTAQPYYTDGKTQTKVLSQTYLNGACTASDGVAPQPGTTANTPPDPPKKPPCADGEGVMTSSTGAVHCVPSGIPGSNPPVVSKEKSVATNADGSTTTTESTTTRDPSTGVEEKTTVKTDRNGSGQVTGTSSETGTKGTTQAGDPNKPSDSEFCAKNPNLQICKGGLNEEVTQKKVATAAEKVRDSLDAKDFSGESFFEGKEVSAGVKADVEAKMNSAKGEIEAFASGGPGSQYFDVFKSNMGDWFEPIGNAGCQAFTVRVGPWTWTHDHCAVAAKIAEIGAYAMWVMLAFGIFSMTTRDHR
ncbi:MAG: hypothetical protein WA049_13160 [Ferribacterium limneticum]